MNEALYRLVYVSRNCMTGSEEDLAREIASILEVSRRLNAPDEISGALMYNSGCFAQVLEGEHDVLQDTFERIQCDERHTDVRLLGLDGVAERGFGDWSMAYVGENEASRRAFEEIAPNGALDVHGMPPDRIFGLLREHLLDAERDLDRMKRAA